MKPYFLGMLVKSEKAATPLSKEEEDKLTHDHLAYIRSRIESGKYILAGPFRDDTRVRGIVVIDAASLEEAKLMLEADPAVKSGRMAAEVHPCVLPDLSSVRVIYGAPPSKVP